MLDLPKPCPPMNQGRRWRRTNAAKTTLVVMSADQQSVKTSLNEGRFRLAFDNAPIGMAIVALDYRLERVNRSLCEALGYSETELLTRTFVDITHPDDIKSDKELAAKLFRGD